MKNKTSKSISLGYLKPTIKLGIALFCFNSLEASNKTENHMISAVETVNRTTKDVTENLKLKQPPCLQMAQSEIQTIKESDYNESILTEPFLSTPLKRINNPSCGDSSLGDYRVCKKNGLPEIFALKNTGQNPIVPKVEDGISREYEFNFEDRARSDMYLLISDGVDDRTSSISYTTMVFLPRKVLPRIKKENNFLYVTLPNLEVVVFDEKTHEIKGGVLSEGPQKQNPKNKYALPSDVQYNGNGVVISVSKNGGFPHQGIEKKDGTMAPSTLLTTVSKKGFKDCKIPVKDIWFEDKARANLLVKKELESDDGMDQFIKNRCGFSIF
jgi:hypothetical protein